MLVPELRKMRVRISYAGCCSDFIIYAGKDLEFGNFDRLLEDTGFDESELNVRNNSQSGILVDSISSKFSTDCAYEFRR